jgi:Zn-dependent protease
VSNDGYSPPAYALAEFQKAHRLLNWRRHWSLKVVLLIGTLLTTTVYGTAAAACFYAGQPFQSDLIWAGYGLLVRGSPTVLHGLMFSVPLLSILLAHELGHYFACRRYHVRATLPYFFPSPSLLGTCGAFILIKSPIYTRRSLFDIGISGPIAGFLALLPFLVIGVGDSRVIPNIASRGDFIFGTPLLIRLFEAIRFPGVPTDNIALHPFAQAAWAGLLATAINLLPIGQLDGGHILYAFVDELHRPLSRFFFVMLLPMGIFFSWSWLLWAVLLFFLGLRHTYIDDPMPLDRARKWIGVLAVVILVLSLSPTPVRAN